MADRMRERAAITPEATEPQRYGADYLTHARLGQGAFRVLVTDAYHRRCAITGERTLPVLEADHIRSYSETGPHLISNGLLLRSDLHILFDEGYVTLTEDLRVQVSDRIKEEFENGREYYQHRGKPLVSPYGARRSELVSARAIFFRVHRSHFGNSAPETPMPSDFCSGFPAAPRATPSFGRKKDTPANDGRCQNPILGSIVPIMGNRNRHFRSLDVPQIRADNPQYGER